MITRSKITNKIYDADKVWYVGRIDQINFYNENGGESEVLDIIYDSRKQRFIFVYPHTEFMSLLYEKWIAHSQNIRGLEETNENI